MCHVMNLGIRIKLIQVKGFVKIFLKWFDLKARSFLV